MSEILSQFATDTVDGSRIHGPALGVSGTPVRDAVMVEEVHRRGLRHLIDYVLVGFQGVVYLFIGVGVSTALLGNVWAATVLVLAIAAGLRLGHGVKRRMLGEPLLPSEFFYLGHMVRFPNLYFGFLSPETKAVVYAGVGTVTVGPVLYVAASFGMVTSLDLATRGYMIAGSAALLLALGAAYRLGFGERLRKRLGIRFVPESDLRRHGFWVTFLSYRAVQADRGALLRVERRLRRRAPVAPAILARVVRRPPIVLVQAESFTTSLPQVQSERPRLQLALPHLERMRGSALATGPLEVPTFGGNSMRTEFSVLTGMPPSRLSVFGLDPYRYLARRPIRTLAAHLRSLGYRTVLVHPFDGRFFWRNDVAGNLGFEEFHDLSMLDRLERVGPYVSDKALFDYVAHLVAASAEDRPVFAFVVTMESHGPWYSDRIDAAALDAAYPVNRALDLQTKQYLFHLRNLDAAFDTLHQRIVRSHGGVLALYGDHLPPLSYLAKTANHTSRYTTDYVVLSAGRSSNTCAPRRLCAHELPNLVCTAAGLPPLRGGIDGASSLAASPYVPSDSYALQAM